MARSKTEAEYRVLALSICDGIWLKLLGELEVKSSDSIVKTWLPSILPRTQSIMSTPSMWSWIGLSFHKEKSPRNIQLGVHSNKFSSG